MCGSHKPKQEKGTSQNSDSVRAGYLPLPSLHMLLLLLLLLLPTSLDLLAGWLAHYFVQGVSRASACAHLSVHCVCSWWWGIVAHTSSEQSPRNRANKLHVIVSICAILLVLARMQQPCPCVFGTPCVHAGHTAALAGWGGNAYQTTPSYICL